MRHFLGLGQHRHLCVLVRRLLEVLIDSHPLEHGIELFLPLLELLLAALLQLPSNTLDLGGADLLPPERSLALLLLDVQLPLGDRHPGGASLHAALHIPHQGRLLFGRPGLRLVHVALRSGGRSARMIHLDLGVARSLLHLGLDLLVGLQFDGLVLIFRGLEQLVAPLNPLFRHPMNRRHSLGRGVLDAAHVLLLPLKAVLCPLLRGLRLSLPMLCVAPRCQRPLAGPHQGVVAGIGAVEVVSLG
mmetsp:Transcript_60395/g.141181  ORF Transcript_60395/g.141181 Transcript_60395/m.141181 type:complete len:245 (-) Transcript_60395:303-1037(-)